MSEIDLDPIVQQCFDVVRAEVRQVLQPLVDELRGIRVALEGAVAMTDPPETAAAPAGCQHPVEQRIDFGETDGVADWQCGVRTCGYRTVPPKGE